MPKSISKTVLKGKFIAIKAIAKKKDENSQINNLIFYPQTIERKIVKVRTENTVDSRKTLEKFKKNWVCLKCWQSWQNFRKTPCQAPEEKILVC